MLKCDLARLQERIAELQSRLGREQADAMSSRGSTAGGAGACRRAWRQARDALQRRAAAAGGARAAPAKGAH